MGVFEIGEVAIYMGVDPEGLGKECTVTSALLPGRFCFCRTTGIYGTFDVYHIKADWAAPFSALFESHAARPSELRKRPPPQDWNSILASSPREAEPA